MFFEFFKFKTDKCKITPKFVSRTPPVTINFPVNRIYRSKFFSLAGTAATDAAGRPIRRPPRPADAAHLAPPLRSTPRRPGPRAGHPLGRRRPSARAAPRRCPFVRWLHAAAPPSARCGPQSGPSGRRFEELRWTI